MKDDKFGIVGLISVVAAIVGFFALRKMFPMLATILLIGTVLVGFLLIILVILILVWAFRKPEETENASDRKQIDSLQKEGRKVLIEIRQTVMKLKNQEIRQKSEKICETANKIIGEIKNHQAGISGVRKFFDYYLPTLGKILKNYEKLENSGVVKEETTQSTIQCLSEIQTAMDKQYENLFDKMELDLTVEMEVLSMICKRDGLIPDEDSIV